VGGAISQEKPLIKSPPKSSIKSYTLSLLITALMEWNALHIILALGVWHT